ncbi:hypothetical protein IAT38_005631 [Cryptococcus sp. DSM 104549]
MFHSRPHIEAGDLARGNLTAIIATPGETFHNKYGRYSHDDIIGCKFGSKVHSPPPQNGYIHVLRPTPELWTLSLPHRTQILYLPDISYITMKLGVRVGGKVMEAGTGSGSMTHSLSRTVGPAGQVMSFEYHQPRYEAALNVCKDGFGDAEGVEGVFLDLPAPWEAIPHALKTLRPDIITRICCFSPCLEQVLKTVACLRTEGFSDIYTQEVLIRTHELLPAPTTPYLRTVTSLVDELSAHEKRKEERRLVQMRTARLKAKKAKESEAAAAGGEAGEAGEANQGAETGSKRKIGEAEGEVDAQAAPTSPSPPSGATPLWTEPPSTLSSAILTRPTNEMKGHTSYLTFALLYPQSVRDELAAQESASVRTNARVEELLRAEGSGTRPGSEGEREKTEDGELFDARMDAMIESMTEEELRALDMPA